MLTDLSFINPGEIWPPVSERKRLRSYEANRRLYNGDFDDIFRMHHERIDKTLSNTPYFTALNYFRKVSHKTAGLLWGEPPKFDAAGSGGGEYESLNQIIKNNEINSKGRSSTIDLSRYGNSLFYVRKDETKDCGVIDCISPAIWFPVVKPDNIKEYTHHVLAWKYKETVNDEDKWYLILHIHEKGKVTIRRHYLDSGVIGSLTEKERTILTGLNDFAVIPVCSTDLSDEIYGTSDYDDFESIVIELMVRITQVNKILDKHSMPSMQGPAYALKENKETGMLELSTGDYFVNQSEDPGVSSGNVSYITWDAQLEANFKMIEALLNQLYVLSEMSSALLGGLNVNQGNIPSGSALKRLLISTLDKVNRFKQAGEDALKKAICLCSQLGGKNIVPIEEVSITWQDGLPGDPKEEAETMQIRTGNKPTMSVYRALMQYDRMTKEDAEAEINTIYEEESMADPVSSAVNADPEETDISEDDDDV